MQDILVKLPATWRYVNQFASSKWAPKPSNERCGPAATVMAAAFADPGEFVEEELEHQLYTLWAGPDVPSDKMGTTIEQIKAWLLSEKLGFIDMQSLVDEFNRGNRDPLRLELGHQNMQNVAQIITIVNMGSLHEAVLSGDKYVQGASLYPWPGHGEGVSHVILRIGTGQNIGHYADSAAPSFCLDEKGKFRPARILWSDIEAAGVMHCLAIMPDDVPAPPAGFSFQHGVWPEPPKPAVDLAAIKSDLNDFKMLIDQERAASDARLLKILAELSA